MGAQNNMATFAIALLSILFASSHVGAEAKPNIVFIFADDWGWGDLGCHGHPYLKTPSIDRLASEGAEFYQFTVASGVCSPSRAAVMTGFIARWPGKIVAGEIDDTTPITAVDLLPTFCNIAGVELPRGYVSDGVNQLPALLGKEANRIELFRFPSDRIEKTNLRNEHPDEVRRLNALIGAWKKTLPAEPNRDCFSNQRDRQADLSQTKKK
ncbi:MAG: sulfatase-like hydrolase/transferase [Planctomycetes bacterium]|nr:sulfatase-like hydrolase/transferase [Planctomycetota bacterium]MBL7040402.1 sulfatase-like hydrolase/transferase [Pirellulaceae bacterium]